MHISISSLLAGIDEILDLEKISRGNGPFFSISSWRIECSFFEMFSIVKILKTKFSFSSRNSRFWRKSLFLFSIEWDFANRFSSRKSKFWEKKLIFSLDYSLNFFSNSGENGRFPRKNRWEQTKVSYSLLIALLQPNTRKLRVVQIPPKFVSRILDFPGTQCMEKSYFAFWLDFDKQCFAERESILKRQFRVVEQYSDVSLQKHFMETSTTKSLLWEGMVAQWKGQMQNMQEWDRRLICMESEDQRRRRRDWIFYCIWYWPQ